MQEKKKKRWYQRWWIWVIIVFLVIVIFTPSGEETVEDTKETEEVKVEETKEEDNEKKEEKEEKEEAKTSEHVDNEAQEVLEQMALSIMEESFTGLAEVSFDKANKLYKITSTDPAFEHEIVLMDEGILEKEVWDTMVEDFAFLSDSMKNLVGNGYSIALMDPSNSDKYLLLLTDGKVEYDVFNE